jgi:hypothetical protein
MNGDRNRLITTRLEFHDALREALSEVAAVGCRELWLCDEDFADWPLGELAVIDQLVQWAQAHRRLVVVARHFDEVVRRHSRWVQWRTQWSHVVECRTLEDAEAGEVPTLLLATDLVGVRLFDRVHHRGSLSRDRGDLVRLHETIDAVLQRSVLAFPPTILGL